MGAKWPHTSLLFKPISAAALHVMGTVLYSLNIAQDSNDSLIVKTMQRESAEQQSLVRCIHVQVGCMWLHVYPQQCCA